MTRDTREVLEERGKTHGNFPDHACTWRTLLKACCTEKSAALTEDDAMWSGLVMITHKLARIANGHPTHEDHWRDIAGYATLVADHLLELQAKNDMKVRQRLQEIADEHLAEEMHDARKAFYAAENPPRS